VIIAFKNYKVGLSIIDSPWVGLKWFETFFRNPFAWRLFRNTFMLGVFSLLFGFPAPILLSLLLNEMTSAGYKRVVQTVSYLPHFISTVIIVSLVKEITSLDGLLNNMLSVFGIPRKAYLMEPSWFRSLFVISGIWQGVGWGTIIYLAALSGVDPQLYEAATIDGATRWNKVWNITLPSVLPTVSILLIMSVGGILGADFMKVLLMQNSLTYETSDIIGTYVYREGLENARFSYSAAVGLMMAGFSFLMVYGTNWFSRKFSENSLW